MKLIKVDATTSTNEMAKSLNNKYRVEDFCISAEFQEKGRGQQNTSWQSNRSENLMFTVVYNQLNLDIEKSFCLNAAVCLCLYNVLKKQNLEHIKLKWPNDILADNYKICGILIENTISGTKIKTSYVGIGLNVNQTKFENLPKANSLSSLTNKNFDRNKLLNEILFELKEIPKDLKSNSPENIINVYKRYLNGFNKTTKFKLLNQEIRSGKIRNVELDGRLSVEFDSGELMQFQHKEISQIY